MCDKSCCQVLLLEVSLVIYLENMCEMGFYLPGYIKDEISFCLCNVFSELPCDDHHTGFNA